jgi:hypothetical protein
MRFFPAACQNDFGAEYIRVGPTRPYLPRCCFHVGVFFLPTYDYKASRKSEHVVMVHVSVFRAQLLSTSHSSRTNCQTYSAKLHEDRCVKAQLRGGRNTPNKKTNWVNRSVLGRFGHFRPPDRFRHTAGKKRRIGKIVIPLNGSPFAHFAPLAEQFPVGAH